MPTTNISKSEVSKLLRACRKQGMTVSDRTDGKGHWTVTKKGSGAKVPVSATPGNSRSFMNTIASLRREFGLEWKGRKATPAPRYVARPAREEKKTDVRS